MKRFALLVLALVLGAALTGCAPAAVRTYADLPSLLDEGEFSDFSLPTSLPAGFLLTELSWRDKDTVHIRYEDSRRSIDLMAAPKERDRLITDQISALPEKGLLEIDGHAVAFYQTRQDYEAEGLMIWSAGDVVYSLGFVTPQEAAGMIYSLEPAAALLSDSSYGRPRQSYDSVAALEQTLGVQLYQPVSLADNYTFSRCFAVGGVIGAAEYTNGTDTLLYQVCRSELVNKPSAGDRSETETFFSGTDHELRVTLPYQEGESRRSDAQWTQDGVHYRLSCSGEVSREQILTLAREFCAWMESGS